MGLDAPRLEMIRANAAFAIGELADLSGMDFPFAKVGKQLDDGLEGGELILSFYNVCVKHIATGQLGKAAASEASRRRP